MTEILRYPTPPAPKDAPKYSPRPVDAATLILVRRQNKGPQVLMGQRHKEHKFMPNLYVFPGGRVSQSDSRIQPTTPLPRTVERRLRHDTKRANVQALALAAVRETFEETGLLVGKKSGTKTITPSRSPEWRPFYDLGVEPALDGFDFLCRAVTPPKRTRRFDTRFFLADANLIQGDVHDTSNASGELLDLRWVTFKEAQELDLPSITQLVLNMTEKRLNATERTFKPVYIRRLKDEMVGRLID